MRLGLVASLLCLCTVSLCLADPAKAAIRKDLNVPPESLSPALQQVATTYELQVLYPTQVAKDLKTHGALGFFTPDDALKAVLSGTGLSYKYLDANTVTVFSTAAPAGVTAAAGQDQTNTTQDNSKEVGKKSSQDFRVAQVDQGQTSSRSTVKKPDEQPSNKKPVLEEVVVTGSRIPSTVTGQGVQDVRVYSQEQIEQSGQTTVADFLSTIPGASVAVGENGFQTADNSTTVQLHGLPIGTTLVLLNGRRVESSGPQHGLGGFFFDLNIIPLAAIDRIEVLSAGSSAVYGSDAIAGVVNIILKTDFNGFEVNAKYGWASGIDETSANVAWGKHWDRGSVSIVASYQTRGELDGSQRSITANQDYRRYGGIDARAFSCNPGNVFSTDGSNLPGVGAPYAGVPSGFTGKPTQQEFAATAGQLNECSLDAYSSFIPETHRTGVLASGTYSLTPSVTVFSEFMFSHVEELQKTSPQLLFAVPGFTSYTASASNPYNPFGVDVGVGYLLTGLGRTPFPVDTDFVRPLVGVKGTLFTNWKWEVSAWDSQDRENLTSGNTANSVAIGNALNSSDPATALNPFVDGPGGSPSLLRSLVFDQLTRYSSQTLAADGLIRGPLVPLPAGAVDVVFGGEYYRDKLYSDQVNSPFYPPNFQQTLRRTSYAAFAEARVPILANPVAQDGGAKLEATLAGRYDHYSDFGSKTTPQIGAVWRPFDGLLLRATYGRAFKAPSLYSLHGPSITSVDQVADPLLGNQAEFVTVNSGSNPHLQPETGQTRTIGFVYSGNAVPNLRLSITHWSIDESQSIQALTDQAIVNFEQLFPGDVIRSPTCSGGPPCPITQINATSVNFGHIQVAGLDYAIAYKVQTAYGEFVPTLSATQTYHYVTSIVPGSPPQDRAGIANDDGNFAPRWKGTLALGWKLGPFAASVVGRYVGHYQDYDSTNQIGNFWLCDANIRYAVGRVFAPSDKWLRDAYVELGGINILNTLPQYSNYSFGIAGYDPAEADLRGRFLYAQAGIKF